MTYEQERRIRVRIRRRAALLANYDVLADRLVGIRKENPFAYSVNLPTWW